MDEDMLERVALLGSLGSPMLVFQRTVWCSQKVKGGTPVAMIVPLSCRQTGPGDQDQNYTSAARVTKCI